MNYKGKTVFITGGASGIGKECALKYGKAGAYVAIADWNHELNEQTAAELKAQNIKVKAYKLDVGSYEQVASTIAEVVSDFGSLDVALNNAGIGGKAEILLPNTHSKIGTMSYGLTKAVYSTA